MASRTKSLPLLPPGPETAEGELVTISYDNERCIHARHCVLEQPGAFKANVAGKWIDPDAATAEGLVVVAHMCPSGAIQYHRHDGGADERAPNVNVIHLRQNGALAVRAEFYIEGERVGFRATLCRCGASHNKPFCDGSHVRIAFEASGEPPSRESRPLDVRAGRLDVELTPDGPLLLRGAVEICSSTGRTITRTMEVALCRCGGSANKPFCDGSHARNGFRSDR